MAEHVLPEDFKEFLKLLNANAVEYLLIGGYAVGYYGYPRTTADMDIWVALNPSNASKLVSVLQEFGMEDEAVAPALFLQPGKIIRMGVPPMRIEVLTEIDGVEFNACFADRKTPSIDGECVRHRQGRQRLQRVPCSSLRIVVSYKVCPQESRPMLQEIWSVLVTKKGGGQNGRTRSPNAGGPCQFPIQTPLAVRVGQFCRCGDLSVWLVEGSQRGVDGA